MNAGLPGTGLGGLFYIGSALFMPMHRVARGAGHSGRTWRRVAAQVGMALGITATLLGTGWALGLLFTPDAAALAGGRPAALAPVFGVLRWVAILGTLGLLALLLIAVEVAGAVLARPTPAGGRAVRRSRPRPRGPAPAAQPGGHRRRRKRGRRAGGPGEDLPRVA